MKLYKKFIFDLDYTLLIPDWSKEDDYLKEHIPAEEQEEFFKQKQDILNKYELEYPKYDFKTLSDYFKSHGFTVSEETISGWMTHNGKTIEDQVADGAAELLGCLKAHGKKIIILTNWFSGTQIPRLEKKGLLGHIDKIVAGEDAMKPNLESFELAIGSTPKEECIMIGDNPKSDGIGAQNAGIDFYLVDKEHTLRDFLNQFRAAHVRPACRTRKK